MRRIPSLLVLVAMLGAAAVAGPPAGPLRVATVIPPGPYYVGQAIEVRVEVEGVLDPPAVEPARATAAIFRTLPRDRARPSGARFVVVPERPGLLDVPAFRARSGNRSGASQPTRLAVSNVPAEGRTSAFLGGVGPFEVQAEAQPTSLHPGQSLELRIKVSGQAAWGSVRAPDLGEWSSLTPGFRVEPLSDSLEGTEPPVRTFRYRLRPSRDGRAILPPVAVASFDPRTRRYATRATAGVPIQVEESPGFDPDRLDYEPRGTPEVGRRGLLALGLGLIALAGGGFWFFSKRHRRTVQVDRRAIALELARGLRGTADDAGAGRAVTEALTLFLQRVEGRSSGALTPAEAREGVARATDDGDLACFAERLLVRCDRARYGPRGEDASELISEGRRLFEGIAEVARARRGCEGEPREAAVTAKESSSGQELPPILDPSDRTN
jgi:hypothetical protein